MFKYIGIQEGLGKMRSKLIILLSVLTILSLNMISAEIMFSQPKAVYSIGDFLEVSATIKATSEMSGFVTLSLNCNGEIKDFYLSPSFLASGEQEKVEKKLLLSRAFLDGMEGICRLDGKYNLEYYSGPSFQITDKIDNTFNINPVVANPGESLVIRGTAVKANGQNLEGFVEISVLDAAINIVRSVNRGKYDLNFSLPDNAKAGNYGITIKVYDKSGNDIGNQDIKSTSLILKQQPRKVEITLDKQNIKPGESIQFAPAIYDQAGDEVDGEVKLEIIDNSESVYLSKVSPTNEKTEVSFPENISAGYWKIVASSLGLKGERLLFIEELEKARFEIIDDTLTVINVGNVPYKKTVQIKIGNNIETKDISLNFGEMKQFRLMAPDGNYNVEVTDGTEEVQSGSVGLTGDAVSIMDINNQTDLFNKYPIVWLFLIVVFGLFVVMIAGKFTKGKFQGSLGNFKEGERVTTRKFSEMVAAESKEGFTLVKEANNAEHAAVMDGKKEMASIIALKFKTPGVRNNKMVKESIDKISSAINRHKGSLYESGDNMVGVFTPSLTKGFRNELTAVRVASEIAASLNEHNRKFKDKINFGIGIHSGEIATKFEGGKLKFNALGNTLNLAKRIADKAQNDVLLSKDSNSKVSGEVKTDKNGEYYSLKRIVDREQHKAFLDNFMKKNNFN